MGKRVLVCKVGLDGHETGAKLVASILRDGGYEVIYTGMRRTVDDIVGTAIDEDVDLIGVSLLSGTHVEVAKDLQAALREADAEDIPVVFGGILPPRDHDDLLAAGVKAVFTPGATSTAILEKVNELVDERTADLV